MDTKNLYVINTPFINLQSDYGFKRLFGSEEFKSATIKFLQVALGHDIEIMKVEPHNIVYY